MSYDFGVYIIYSQRINRYYIGACQDGVEQRIKRHNSSSYGNHRYTSQTNDWELFVFIETDDVEHAIRLERKIKQMKSRKYIQKLKMYDDLREKVVQETRRT